MQVLASLMLGKTNREIGRELFVAESTVKSHVASIFRKLGVSTRTEAAVVGWETFPMLRGPSEYQSAQTVLGNWNLGPDRGPGPQRHVKSTLTS